ncbi:tetratricopeptide repeat protein [Flavobacterium sp. Sd200]|uniref:LytTR family transcriptional regulator DNA-binding domain-containing protein n=1 Tax=Flavobacterium sp. Sd200 TaxID=2692211 RepID=UPI00136C46D8|nr:LytTR family transcriptional regulator DNA-binding domain-containing protein [Flavobacterium sp. Sd200]MXN91631.1 tetratricopeptide repeat protein [Flavobacterium sp. Sd200]
MRYITLFLFLLAWACNGQNLQAFIPKEATSNPQEYLHKAKKNKPATAKEVAGNYYAVGKCYEYLNHEDIALKYYMLAKQRFEKLRLTEFSKEMAFEIHKLISSQENYTKYGNSFFKEYYNYAKETDNDQKLAKCYSLLGTKAVDYYDLTDNAEMLDTAKVYYNKGLKHADGNIQAFADLNHNLAVVETKLGNFKTSRSYLDKSRKYLDLGAGNDFDLCCNYCVYGVCYFFEQNYPEAIKWLKKAEAIQIPKYKAKTTRLIYKKLMESYDAVNDQPNRRKYQKLYLDLEKQINDEEQNIAIHDIDVKYEVKQKDRQISLLSGIKERFERHRIIFSTLLFLVFLLALYSFIRWKKVDYNKKKLEAEKQTVQAEKAQIEEQHTKTVEELEKVKNIVIQDYITLKDKTKIYLNDLMYVKAEDHYLHAFSKDGKKHFVRGKLSQLSSELPPNFVKCHRSYIVNTNYIQATNSSTVILKNKEEIPVSRGFKWN